MEARRYADAGGPASAPYLSQPPSLPLDRPDGWIDFSQTANPLGTPRDVAAALADAQGTCGPDAASADDGEKTAAALGSRDGFPGSWVLPASSIGALLRGIARSFKPCSVGVPAPARRTHFDALDAAGHRIVEISGPAGSFEPAPLESIVHRLGFNAVLLANPSFPTSRLLDERTLLSYVKTCSWVVVDERSIDLSLGGATVAGFVREWPNLIVVRSLAEPFDVPSLPISYCIAQPELITRMAPSMDPLTAPALERRVSELAAQDESHLEATADLLDEEIPWLQCMVGLVPGVRAFPAEANYVACRFDHELVPGAAAKSTADLIYRLEENGCLVRSLKGMRGIAHSERCFAVSVRNRSDNERLVSALRSAVLG